MADPGYFYKVTSYNDATELETILYADTNIYQARHAIRDTAML